MNLSTILTMLGVALNSGGVATTGWISTAMHIVGGIALYFAKSPVNHISPDDTSSAGV